MGHERLRCCQSFAALSRLLHVMQDLLWRLKRKLWWHVCVLRQPNPLIQHDVGHSLSVTYGPLALNNNAPHQKLRDAFPRAMHRAIQPFVENLEAMGAELPRVHTALPAAWVCAFVPFEASSAMQMWLVVLHLCCGMPRSLSSKGK